MIICEFTQLTHFLVQVTILKFGFILNLLRNIEKQCPDGGIGPLKSLFINSRDYQEGMIHVTDNKLTFLPSVDKKNKSDQYEFGMFIFKINFVFQ